MAFGLAPSPLPLPVAKTPPAVAKLPSPLSSRRTGKPSCPSPLPKILIEEASQAETADSWGGGAKDNWLANTIGG